MTTIGEKLQEIMDWRGLHQSDVARLTGVSPTMISEYIRGKSDPTVSAINKLADGLGISAWTLLNGDPLAVDSMDLTKSERILVGSYRMLDAEERETVDHLLRTLNRRKAPKPPL